MYVFVVGLHFSCLCLLVNAWFAWVIALMCFFRRIIYNSVLWLLSCHPCCHRWDGNSSKSVVVIIYLCFLVFCSTTSCLDWHQCVLHLFSFADPINLFCSHCGHRGSLLVHLTVKILCRLSAGSSLLPTCIFILKSDVCCGKRIFYHRWRCWHTVGYS